MRSSVEDAPGAGVGAGDGEMSDWPGVNCGFSVSTKPVSTNDARLDVCSDSGGLMCDRCSGSLRSGFTIVGIEETGVGMEDCPDARSLPGDVSCVLEPSELVLRLSDIRELKWEQQKQNRRKDYVRRGERVQKKKNNNTVLA